MPLILMGIILRSVRRLDKEEGIPVVTQGFFYGIGFQLGKEILAFKYERWRNVKKKEDE